MSTQKCTFKYLDEPENQMYSDILFLVAKQMLMKRIGLLKCQRGTKHLGSALPDARESQTSGLKGAQLEAKVGVEAEMARRR